MRLDDDPKIVICGREGSGKSLEMADTFGFMLARNKRWQKKYGFTRPIYSNMAFSRELEDKATGGFLEYYNDFSEVINLEGVDIIADEIHTAFPALRNEPFPPNINNWLRQGHRRGTHIYAIAQEFHDIHLDFRRRVTRAYYAVPLIGPRRPGLNKPPGPKHPLPIRGMYMLRELKIDPYNELERKYTSMPLFDFRLITQNKINAFRTNEIIDDSELPPYEHLIRGCKLDMPGEPCDYLPKYKRVIHR